MEKIKIRITENEMEYAYVDNILFGKTINIENNGIVLAGQRVLDVIENKNNLNGFYIVKLANAYIKNDDIIVDLRVVEKKERFDKISNSIKIYNAEKYKKTHTYKYLSKNSGKLMTTALSSVKKVIKDNSFMVDIIKQKVLNSKSDVEKIYLLNYLNNECGGQGKCAFNNLTDLEPAYYVWNPVFQDGRMELHTMLVNYINLHNLNGIVFIKPTEIEYIKMIGEENEMSKNRDKNKKIYDIIKETDAKTTGYKNSLLAAYCYIDNDNLANSVKMKLGIEDEGFGIGKYIFIVADSIDGFIKKNIEKIYSTKRPKCYDSKDENCIQNCPLCNKKEKLNVMETVIKLIFLHEVGHMAFSNCSRKNKMVVDETAANFFASMCVKSLPEKCLIREITKFQPIEYKYYFPALLSLKPIKFYYTEQEPGFRDYSIESIFRTLKYGLLRTDEYDRLSKDLIKNLYY